MLPLRSYLLMQRSILLVYYSLGPALKRKIISTESYQIIAFLETLYLKNNHALIILNANGISYLYFKEF